MHHTRFFSAKKRWGLPGGRIEPGEDTRRALIRELQEELYLSVDKLVEVGDYRYKGHFHRVYATEVSEPIIRFDRSEIKSIGWHSLENIEAYETRELLHTGFELQAIRDLKKKLE